MTVYKEAYTVYLNLLGAPQKSKLVRVRLTNLISAREMALLSALPDLRDLCIFECEWNYATPLAKIYKLAIAKELRHFRILPMILPETDNDDPLYRNWNDNFAAKLDYINFPYMRCLSVVQFLTRSKHLKKGASSESALR